MSRMSALLYLEHSPRNLRALEIEIDKTLTPFMSEGGWKRKSGRFDFGWMFDFLDFPSSDTSKFVTFDKPSGIYVSIEDSNDLLSQRENEWSGFSKTQKKSVPIEEVLKICEFENYLETAGLSEAVLDEIIEDGLIIFPDGSRYEDRRFEFKEGDYPESGQPGSVTRQVSRLLVDIASAAAVKKLLQRPGASLLLCTFHTRPY